MNIKNKTLLTLALVATAVAAPVQKAEARGFHHHGGFHHCHGGWGRGGRHFWGGFAGGVVGGLVGGWVRPYYTSPVVVSTPYYTTPTVVTTPTVISTPTYTPAPVVQPQQTVVREVIKEAPAPQQQQAYPKLNPGETMTIKPDGTVIITRQGNVPVQVLNNQNER
jgi:hypothetical protein